MAKRLFALDADILCPDGERIIITDVDDRLIINIVLRSGKKRNIGQLVKGKYIKSLEANHLFKKLDAFGFNENVINHFKPTWLCVCYSGCNKHKKGWYIIPRKVYERHKQYLHFKKGGFELQVFIPVNKFLYRGDKI